MRVAYKRTEMGSRDDFTPSEIALARREGVRLERRFSQRIENPFAKLKENRRLALRVDKLEATFGGFLTLAFIKDVY
jgi:hypothetical protein